MALNNKKNGFITELNGINVTSILQLTEMITKARSIKEIILTITVSTVTRSAMHPIFGVPQLHHDQLNIIVDHLKAMKSDTQLQRDTADTDDVIPIINN